MKKRQSVLICSVVGVCCLLGITVAFLFNLPNKNKSTFQKQPYSSSEQSKPKTVSAVSAAVDSAESASTSSGEETYWLHESGLKLPSKSACLKAQKQALHGLTDAQIKTVQDIIRDEHVRIEFELLDHVKILKSSSDPHWEFWEHTGVISIPGEGVVDNQWAKSTILQKLNKVDSIIQDETVKPDFKRMKETLETAIDTHNLHKLFAYHEMIHDYDYWVINYPAFYPTAPAPDWGGIETYFGTTSLLPKE